MYPSKPETRYDRRWHLGCSCGCLAAFILFLVGIAWKFYTLKE